EVSLEGADFLPPLHVPHAHRPVGAGAGEALAVRAERDAPDVLGVPREGADFRTGPGVPHPHGLLVAGAGEALAVRAPGHGQAAAVVPVEAEEFLARPGVPYLHLAPVIPLLHIPSAAGGGQAFAVRAEAGIRNRLAVPREGEEFLAGGGVPHLHRLVPAG